jgi:membrane protein implicated in regulation of membrane protease activity
MISLISHQYVISVYFIVFIFIGMFLLLSVLLAVIVEFWLSYLKKTNDSEKRKERLGITKAFIWIDKDR